MPRNQFAKVRPGEILPGLPSQPWNELMGLLGPEGLGVNAGGGFRDGAAEFHVVNTTGSAVPRFGLLQINAPLNTVAVDLDTFKADGVLKGIAPAADKPFVVFQEGVGAGEVGRARVLGVTKVRVDVTSTAHVYAKPGTSTSQLSSAAGGPARLVWQESGTGVKWAVALLAGATAAKAAYARFSLSAGLTTTTASVSASVDDYWGGADPGASITVYNLPASSDYIFAGASGHKGLAAYDDRNDKYWIVQLECP